MGLYGTFRLTFGTRDFKYIIGTVPQESGRVVTLLTLPGKPPMQTPVEDLADLCGRIMEMVALVTPEILSRVWKETEYRLDITCTTNGAHIEIH